jgi:hypothetical protein
MPRGSKPGERCGGRQRATPNKRTVLRERLLTIASANPTAAARELLLSLVNDPLRFCVMRDDCDYANIWSG